MDTNRVAHPDPDDTLTAHYAGLERLRPHGCYNGWHYLGFEAEDESGEIFEVIERVPCRRCHAATEAL